MPIYSYHCESCERRWDELRHVREKDDPATCTKCEQPANRRVTAHGGVQGVSLSAARPKHSTSFKGGEQLEFDFDKKD